MSCSRVSRCILRRNLGAVFHYSSNSSSSSSVSENSTTTSEGTIRGGYSSSISSLPRSSNPPSSSSFAPQLQKQQQQQQHPPIIVRRAPLNQGSAPDPSAPAFLQLSDSSAHILPVFNTQKIRRPGYPFRPVSEQMVREYIHHSLYNSQNGYFSAAQHIYSSPFEGGIPFKQIKDRTDFLVYVNNLYAKDPETSSAQSWHTPTEIFKPWYAYAVADYILHHHRERIAKENGGEPSGSEEPKLTCFEIGGGNGTLMVHILDRIRNLAPDIYHSMEYNMIEISPILSKRQAQQIAERKHERAAKVHNMSMFRWTDVIEQPCFLLAFELLDNLAHDRVLFLSQGVMEGRVQFDDIGDGREVFVPLQDKLLTRFLEMRSRVTNPTGDRGIQVQPTSSAGFSSLFQSSTSSAARSHMIWNQIKQSVRRVFEPHSEFAPTMAFRLLEIFRDHFPRAKLVMSDFDLLLDSVSDSIPNAPVVQRRLEGTNDSIACSTYIVSQGKFDIFFPTDFDLLRRLYAELHQRSPNEIDIVSHRQFMEKWGNLSETRTKVGYNPMSEDYANVKFFLS